MAVKYKSGKFVDNKSSRAFSVLPTDQAHELSNGVIKVDGSAVGITEDLSTMRRWMVAGQLSGKTI
jgi:hypothetical protein